MRTLSPADEAETAEAVAAALSGRTPLEIVSGASRGGFGRPVEAQARLSMKRLTGVVFYEPAELVICARAATPMTQIEEALASRGQELAFEPIDHGRFYGVGAGAGTIGGAIATNASGPRRLKAGAARDHLLGFRGVTGRGDAIKSGGRVMKNVTGYDLSKLAAGSHGTLLVLTEVTLKTLPKAETEITVLIAARDEGQGLTLLRQASMGLLDASGLALTPASPSEPARAALRLEGPSLSVERRRGLALSLLRGRESQAKILDEAASRAFWAEARDGGPVRSASGQIWRISTAPSEGGNVLEALRRAGVPIESHFYDWAGGLVWIAVAPAVSAHAPAVRAVVDRIGGHATLMRADARARAQAPAFHPQPAALAALSARVKLSFDPLRLLNRGRMRPDS